MQTEIWQFPPGTHPSDNELNKRVIEIARRLYCHVYLVGGYVRDAFLGRLVKDASGTFKAKDLDYAVDGGPALDLAKAVATELSGHLVLLDESHDTYRVVLDDQTMLDFAGLVGGTLERDIKRRDFTINALVWDPNHPQEIIDLVNGLADLQNLVIRALSADVLKEDPLRMLRAYRFKATLNARIDNQTQNWIKENAWQLATVAAERINLELFTIFGIQNSDAIVRELAEVGLLEMVFPELTATRKVSTNAFHHLGLFEHSLEAVTQLEMKLPVVSPWVHDNLGY
jgi:tRNA nucleotidyltransferase/poly(A) polymerase